ncbi:exosortase/archaeosortase family protein, partial [Myxococcota bacterium]|nr:exosortase/archaeosortase family protein [Myxococcota bacterium]
MRAGRHRAPPPGLWIALAVGLFAALLSHRFALLGQTGSASPIPLLDQWLYAPSMTSPALALGLFAILVLRRWATLAAIVREGQGRAWGLAPLAMGAALLLWSRQIGADHLAMLSLVIHVVGLAAFCGGARLVRGLVSPLVVLMLAVPLPPPILHEIVFPMQLWAASLASSLLALVGHAHELRGDLIYSGPFIFHVVEGCCGFKSTLSLVLAAIVYGDFVLARPGARLALAVAALPIGLLANSVRVSGLIVGRIPTESPAHTTYG